MHAVNTIFNYSACYAAFFLLTAISKQHNSNRLFNNQGIPAENTVILTALHIAGLIYLGLVPWLFFKHAVNPVLRGSTQPGFLWLPLFSFLLTAAGIAGFRASRRIHIRYSSSTVFSKTFLTCYFAVRILFLAAYELFFRGFVLFEGIQWLGTVPAILLSTALTVLIHVFTNKKEMWACVPFGILLSLLCIAINGVWPAVIIHVVLSLCYEVPPLYQFSNNLKTAK